MSRIYSEVQEVQISQCKGGKAEFLINFFGDTMEQGEADVRVSLDSTLALIKFDVLMYGIPMTNQGQEVTVNFHAPKVRNGGVFYTDSNGLEMQRRELNHRDTWRMSPLHGSMNVTANYYPVTSAISIRDDNL